MKLNKTTKVLRILIVLILLVLASSTVIPLDNQSIENPELNGIKLSITQDKNNAQNIIIDISDESLRNININDKYELRIVVDDVELKYFGELIFPLKYTKANSEGEILLIEKSTGKTIDKVSMNSKPVENEEDNENNEDSDEVPAIANNESGLLDQGPCKEVKITLNKNELSLNQIVTLGIENNSNETTNSDIEVLISDGQKTFRYMGTFKQASFVPQKVGQYTVMLECRGEVVDTKEFLVNPNTKTPEQKLISYSSALKINESNFSTSLASVKAEMPDGVVSDGTSEIKYLIEPQVYVNEVLEDAYIITTLPRDFIVESDKKIMEEVIGENKIVYLQLGNVSLNESTVVSIGVKTTEYTQNKYWQIPTSDNDQLLRFRNDSELYKTKILFDKDYIMSDEEIQKFSIKVDTNTDKEAKGLQNTINTNLKKPIEVSVTNNEEISYGGNAILFRWTYNPDKTNIRNEQITKECSNKKIYDSLGNKILECEWTKFNAYETKSFYIYPEFIGNDTELEANMELFYITKQPESYSFEENPDIDEYYKKYYQQTKKMIWSISDMKYFSLISQEPDSQEEVIKNKIKIAGSKNQAIFGDVQVELKGQPNENKIKIDFPDNNPLKQSKLEIENIDTTNDDLNIKIEDLDYEEPVNSKKSLKSYAIDLSEVNFTNGTFTTKAKGTELWKCKEWDFNSQSCQGSWTKLKDILPGQEYSIDIYPEDPGYVELGLATINTNKSIYYPGEPVDITVIVLDDEGRLLSGADIDVEIEYPDSTTKSYNNQNITETSPGVYQLQHLDTTITGTYLMQVTATSGNYTKTMNSYFLIDTDYEFDVERNTVPVIDPFSEPFITNISVSPTINVSSYNYTEIIPLNFTNIYAPGATITSNNNEYKLTWFGLSGQSDIYYEADAPQVSPALLEIGPSYIDYDTGTETGTFYEAKPWYLALDPTLTDQNIAANTTTPEQDDSVLITGNILCGGGGKGINYDVWIEDDTVQIDTTTTNRDFSCAGSGSVSVTLCEAATCTVNSDCSVTVADCRNNDDVDIEWTLTANGDNEALPSTNTIEMNADIGNSLNNQVSVTISAASDSTPPTTTLNYPGPNYINSNATQETIDFNCSATDETALDTIAFYLTNSVNASFSLNDTCSASGGSQECIFTETLLSGNYTWNCLANDTSGNTDWATNRTITINGSESTFSYLLGPANGTKDGDGNVLFQCNGLDDVDIVNITLYTNHSGGWQQRDVYNATGGSDTDVDANFTIYGLANNTNFVWNCLVEDNTGYTVWSTNRSLTVLYRDEYPQVILNSPGNATTENTEPVTFSCSANDNSDLASINLYTNKNGPFQFEATKQYTGDFDDNKTATFQVSGFTDGSTILWNCKAIDNNSNEAFASQNRTLYVNFLEPNVTLLSPSDFDYDVDGNVNITCNAQDNSDLVNISLYHNIGGSWLLNQTANYAGGSNTNENATFELFNVPGGTTFQWNCVAYDEDGFTGTAISNYTLTIPPDGTNYYAPDGYSGGTWTNPNRADEEPDGSTANSDLDSQFNLFTYNYSGIPTQGTLLDAYLTMRWSVSTQPSTSSPDYLGIQYSPDSAANYYDLTGTLNAYTQPPIYPSSQTNVSYRITGSLNLTQLQSLYYRITGFKVSGPDDVSTLVDSIWLTAKISPPPRYSNIGKNQTLVEQDNNITFYTYWTDDINLDCYIFSINQGAGWTNSSCINLQGKSDNATTIQNITATPGTTVYWMFYARDNFGDYNQTPVQSFTVIDPNDIIYPKIYNVTATPSPIQSTNLINISADVTDNIAVISVSAEITKPSGGVQNYSMTQGSGYNWYLLYNTTQGGIYNYTIYATDGADNTNYSSGHQFNVTSYVTTSKVYYDRSEVVRITGYGFTSSEDVVFNGTDSGGQVLSGFPYTDTADSDGEASYDWTIPSPLTFFTGNYTIYGKHITDSNLRDNTSIEIVIKPYYASKTDDVSLGDIITGLVNETDDTTTTLVGDAAEAYVELRYTDLLAEGYNLDDLVLNVEHQDLDPESDTIDIQYYDGATWAAASCGSLTFSSAETISQCNMTADIASIPNKNDVRIRLSDGNDGNDGVNFAKIDFAFLRIQFSITNNLAVTINYPDYVGTTYDYKDTASNSAYDGPATAKPPASQVTGTEASGTEYTYLANSDNNRWQTIVTNSGEIAYQSFYFTISQSRQDVNLLTLTHEGYATQRTSLTADPYRIYMWNYNTNVYDIISVDPITGVTWDKTTSIELSTGFTDYIDTNGEINVLIQADYTLAGCGNPANCRGDLNTDYISLTANSYRTIGGIVDINVTAVDGDGVQSCTYRYENGTPLTSYPLYNISSTIWTNQSDTSSYAEGLYNISVNCTDGTEVNDTEYVTVRILNNAPYVTLLNPDNNTNFTASSVNFSWNASSGAGNPLCDLYIDGTEELSNVVSQSGQNTTRQVNNIDEGSHTWYVRCNIAGGAYNTTETRTFRTDTKLPRITLNNPQNNDITNQTSATFNYTPYDENDLTNCSLNIDGAFDQLNSSPILNNQPNTFSKTLSEGNHNWSITCVDTFGRTNTSDTRDIVIDTTKPTIILNDPDPEQVFLGGLVQFNYTATDNQDNSLVCNISIDGFVEDANIASANATDIIRTIVVGDGFKEWNVTCIDNGGNTNTSETRNFSVQGPPTINLLNPGINDYLGYQAINFTYYVEDSDNLTNCSIYIDGLYNDTNSTIGTGDTGNFSKTIVEGEHNWTIDCYDTLNNYAIEDWRNFTVDLTAPNITLYAPDNESNQTNRSAIFNFTVTDNLDDSLTCNITVNGVVSSQNLNFEASNGSVTSRTQTQIVPGGNYWNVTCEDDANKRYTSETRYFFMTGQPSVVLDSPANNTQELEDVTFLYTPTDDFNLTECSLYINGAFNQTDPNPENGIQNQFQVNFTGEQRVSWYVNCSNDLNVTGISGTNYFDVDLTGPHIDLNFPDPFDTFQTSDIDFNFTATDNNATTIYCDLYLDGTANETGLEPTSEIPEIVPITGIPEGDHYWNVSCYDYAGNSNWSETRNFTISFGPSVSLVSPGDEFVTNSTNLTLTYTVTSGTPLQQCALLINGAVNQTNTTTVLTDGSNNIFNLTGLGEQRFNWTVQCTDTTPTNSTIDEVRYVNIDRTPPQINMTYPADEEEISLSFVEFEFNVTDNLDSLIECTLEVHNSTGLFNSTTLNATNGALTTQQINNFSSGQYYWNLTCSDGFNSNISETKNFTISNTPKIVLNNPYEGYSDQDGYINFTYTPQTIAVGGFQFCSIILDGAVNDSEVIILNGETNWFDVNYTTSGTHTWQINCTDQDSINASSEIRNFSVDFEDPSLVLNYPKGQILNSTVEFSFNATDNLDLNLSCDIYINGTLNQSGIPAENGSETKYNISGFTDAYFEYYVVCSDDSLRTNTSSTENFTVQEAPKITLDDPADNYRTGEQNITLYFTPTDNSGNVTSCLLILNGQANETINPVSEGLQNNVSLTNLPYGEYNWTLNCTDSSGNVGTNNTPRNFTIDIRGPAIALITPYEGETFNYDDIYFNWSANDTYSSDVYCNITLDDVLNVTNISGTSGTDFSQLIENLSEGAHNWSVTCWDDLNNTNNSNTVSFIINSPDLTLNNSDITFSNSNPDLGENITIFANISNIGGIDAEDALIQFWEGIPATGTLIANVTINVTTGSYTVANTSWVINSGLHNIWVIIDPDNTLVELNDSNNNATTNISVLRSLLNAPGNATWTSIADTEINFTLEDYTGNDIIYTIFVDGVANGQTANVTDGSTTLLNVTLAEGTRTITVQATDYLGRKKNSTTITRYVDLNPPTPVFNTANQTWFNYSTPEINFTITDAVDNILNYTIYVNDSPNLTGSANSSVPTLRNLSALSNGTYILILEAYDEIPWYANSSQLMIYVDTVKPTINLNLPVEDENFTTTTVNLNFTATDNMATAADQLACELYVDGAGNQSFTTTSGALANRQVSDLSEGQHNWSVQCWDPALNRQTSETRIFNVFRAPQIILITPPDFNWINQPNQTFYFNVSDDTGLENCSLLLNGEINDTKVTAQLTNGGTNNFTVNNLNGTYTWAVECYDNTTYNTYNISENRTLYVDLDAPTVNITTQNNSWFTANPTIEFNITDNMDAVLDYVVYLDGSANESGTTNSGEIGSQGLTGLSDGPHIIFVEGTDEAGNSRNSSQIRIYVDTDLPKINLTYPDNESNFSVTTVDLNFTPTDNLADYLLCNVTVNGVVEGQNLNVSNASTQNYTMTNLLGGYYYWNVTCMDIAGNINTSETRQFYVEMPDLTVLPSEIYFNDSDVRENETINITATVRNTGTSDAFNFIVEIWANHPNDGGSQIGSNFTLNLTAGEAQNISTIYANVPVGTTQIYILVDTPTSTNGTINEENESNNEVYKEVTVASWHYAYGTTNDRLVVEDADSGLLFDWTLATNNGSNLFAADQDSVISWTELQALGRDTSNNSVNDDFEELDTALGSENFSDSVNATYTSAGAPKETDTYEVFSRTINNVAIYNSTNNTNFKTGILWDFGDGGTEFNGTQDVIFVSKIRNNLVGYGGAINDYEIRVPALLREYKGPGTSTVDFYVEIK